GHVRVLPRRQAARARAGGAAVNNVRRSLSLATAVLLSCSAPGGYPQPSAFGTPSGSSKHLLIGAAGGTMISADGVLTLSIPAGAVAADTDFTITPITNTAPGGQGGAYRVRPDGLLLLAPATVAFQVSGV